MGNALTTLKPDPRATAARATAASYAEYLLLANLVDQYERGEDMGGTLDQLQAMQRDKRDLGLTPADLRAAIHGPRLARLRQGLANLKRACRDFAHGPTGHA